jgi:hypothetical protein
VKIETDDWIPLADACKLAGLSQATGYRTARRLGIVENFFGVAVVRKREVSQLEHNRRRPGNPNWIESWDGAAADAVKAVASRMKKKKKTAE